MTRKLSEETIQKIRQEVLSGKSRYKIASEMGLSPTVIYTYTKDIPNKRQREPCIRGKTLALLKSLLKNGYVSTGKNRTSLRFLQKVFPVIKRSQFKNRSIYYLEDKNKLALREMMKMDSSRIISYQELSRMTQVFNTDIKIMQKRSFIGRNRKRRGYKIKSRKQHHELFSKERQTLLDEFLGRILHSEVLRFLIRPRFGSVPYQKIIGLAITMIAILVFLFTGLLGLLILMVATLIGLLPVEWGGKEKSLHGHTFDTNYFALSLKILRSASSK